MADNERPTSPTDAESRPHVATDLKNYIEKVDVKTLFDELKGSANGLGEVATKAFEILNKPDLMEGLIKAIPIVAQALGKVASVAKLLGPVGTALGFAIDLLSFFGLLTRQDPVMKKLNELSMQIEGLRADVQKGFQGMHAETRAIAAKQQLHPVYTKFLREIESFELIAATNHPKYFFQSMESLVTRCPPREIIDGLTTIHGIIIGEGLAIGPFFELMVEYCYTLEGNEFDQFMVSIFILFQDITSLQMRAIRMLRSMLVFTREDIQHKDDVKKLFDNMQLQLRDHNPVPKFKWYLNFKSFGGVYRIRGLKAGQYVYTDDGSNKYIYGQTDPKGNQSVYKIVPTSGGAYRILSSTFPNWSWVMKERDDAKNIASSNDEEDKRAQWIFSVTGDKKFKLSTANWPTIFIYIESSGYVYKADQSHPPEEFILDESF